MELQKDDKWSNLMDKRKGKARRWVKDNKKSEMVKKAGKRAKRMTRWMKEKTYQKTRKGKKEREMGDEGKLIYQ